MATKTDYYDTLARATSIILGPHVWIPALFFITIFRTGLSSRQLSIVFPTIFILEVVIPIAYLLIGPKLGLTKKWDMESIKERKPFLYMVSVLSLMSLGIIYFFGGKFLFHLSVIYMACLAILLFITRVWKISLHVSLITLAAIMINFLFGWKLLILFLTIPLIFWARLRLKKHSLNQLMAGLVVTVTVLFGGLAIFRYI